MSKNPPTTEPLTAFQKANIEKAVKALTNLGCQLAVIDREGNRFGDLTVVTDGKKRDNSHRYNFRELGYVERVRALEPGHSELFEAPEDVNPERYRAAISACATTQFGPGTCTSHVEGNIIELLRLV